MASDSRQSRWVARIAALLAVLLTAALGVWQLNRAAQKETIAAQTALRAQRPALDAAALVQKASNDVAVGATVLNTLHYRRARVQGTWLTEHTVYLDNRQMHGRPGFFVLTPFQLKGGPETIMVQRGWALRNFADRAALPVVNTTTGEQEIELVLTPPPGRLFDFSTQAEQSKAQGNIGTIRQNIDLKAFALERKLALLLISAQQINASKDDGLLRDWPAADSGVQKHYGYAAQWFGLSALLVVLTLWFQFIKPRRELKKLR